MATSKRDKRRADIKRLLDLYRSVGAPDGSATQRAIWMILARHGTKEGATRAYNALWRRYVDVNEFRVAKPVEIAELIKRHVKNDPIFVAAEARGFLRRFFRDQHTLDFTAVRALTPDRLRRYLAGHGEHARTLGLAILFNLAEAEIEQQQREEDPELDAAQRRAEREVGADLERMRMAAAFAAYGASPAKTKLAAAHRNLLKAWAYAPLESPEAKPAPKKETVAGKEVTKKAAKKKTTTRGGGKAQPRTTRTKRKRAARKSSRR